MTRSRKTLALTFVVAAANCIPAHTTFAAVHEELTDAQKRSLPFGDLTDFSTLEVEAIELSNGVYLLTDAEAKQGALVTAFVGDEEILLVDTAYPEGAPAVLAALRDLSARPISIVVATHWHADDIGAAGFWKRQGARIVAQERTRSRRLSPQTIPAFGKTYPPLPPEDLPDTQGIPTVMFSCVSSKPTSSLSVISALAGSIRLWTSSPGGAGPRWSRPSMTSWPYRTGAPDTFQAI
jgi:hypothetical protein